MKIVVGGIKGGSGKTTIATNLCVIRSATGKKVLLVDADEQRSAYDWASQREAMGIETKWSTIQLSGMTLHGQLNRIAQDYDDIIIDVGGRDTTSQRSALSCADLLIIPFKPRSLDIWTIGQVIKMIKEISIINPNLISLSVISQADSKGNDNEDAKNIINMYSEIICLKNTIGNRKSFSNSIAQGIGVIEMKIKDVKAIEEIMCIYDDIFLAKYMQYTHNRHTL